jgi:hypothetical protein
LPFLHDVGQDGGHFRATENKQPMLLVEGVGCVSGDTQVDLLTRSEVVLGQLPIDEIHQPK